MSVQLQIDEKSGYLKARFIGAGATEEVERQFESLAEKCKSTKKNRLLLDFTEVPADISLVDRYDQGPISNSDYLRAPVPLLCLSPSLLLPDAPSFYEESTYKTPQSLSGYPAGAYPPLRYLQR